MIHGINSTKIKEGNLLIKELLHRYPCPARNAKLISKGWTRYWRSRKKKRSIVLYGNTSLKRTQTGRNVIKFVLKEIDFGCESR